MTKTDALPLSFESPESSLVESACYDPSTKTLRVVFKGRDRASDKAHIPGTVPKEYEYHPIEPLLWQQFSEANSKGHFFTTRIRIAYVGRVIR